MGYQQTAAASSSSETGTPSSAAQQWGRYTPGAGDQRTRNKADKTWIHAEFAKRGWRKPPHLTWRQVEHWLHSPEQRERGEQEQQRQAPTKPHQPGLFTQLLNLHLQPREPLRGHPHTRPPATTGDTRADSRPPTGGPHIQAGDLGTAAGGGTDAAPSTTSSSSGDRTPAKPTSLGRGRPHPSERTTQ